MRIAILNSLYAPHHSGGAELSVQAIAEGLASRGHSVTVATLDQASGIRDEIVNRVRVQRVPLPNVYSPFVHRKKRHVALRSLWHTIDSFNPIIYRTALRLFESYKPDVVQTHNLAGLSTSVWAAARRVAVPVLHTIHDCYLLCPNSVMMRNGMACLSQCLACSGIRAPQRLASTFVAGVIGVSQFILSIHVKSGYFRRAHLRRVINNGFGADVLAGSPAPRTPSSDRLRIGFLGTLCRGKGVNFLMDAVSRLPADRFSLALAGAGEPSYVADLRSRYARVNHNFVGKVDAAQFLRTVDVLVVPSLWNESFGRVVVEAYASGIPVIASRAGGLPELVHDGTTGKLVAPGNVDELAAAIRWFSDSPHEYAKMAASAAREATRFRIENTVAQYESAQRAVASRLEPHAKKHYFQNTHDG